MGEIILLVVVDGVNDPMRLLDLVVGRLMSRVSVGEIVAKLPQFIPFLPDEFDQGDLPLCLSGGFGSVRVRGVAGGSRSAVLCLKECPLGAKPTLKEMRPANVVLLINQCIVSETVCDVTGTGLVHPRFKAFEKYVT